ncbi:hypothetical protein KUG47_11905 [Falsochrobactrum sp. TDYN1]|uniref:Uncharacterized protein n=2 Tax=Falsochrobactrum tianjinense TaxID=2706015 RepID=A0A949PP19_9HYPH|nr:hypothetical protein [Falsochrobactrum sp. TDYN1]
MTITEQAVKAALEEYNKTRGYMVSNVDRMYAALTAAAPFLQGVKEEPIGYLFQHEETGLTQVVEVQQVEWGFEKNNPRWQKISPVYSAPVSEPFPAREQALELLNKFDPHEEANEYEFRGDGGDYRPSETERLMLEDFAAGLLGRIEDAIRALSLTVGDGWSDVDENTPTDGFIMAWSPDHPDLAMIWKAEYFHNARKPGTSKHLSANHFTKWRRIPLPAMPAQERPQ